MANTESARKEPMTEPQRQKTDIERNAPNQQAHGKRRQEGSTLMQRMTDDVDRIFGRFFSDWPLARTHFGETSWPRIEAFRRGNKFVVRADVPGMNKDDIRVEVMDNELTISGERRSESEQSEGDYYRKEVSYGSFRRTINLPPGASADTASASFDKGVLEIAMDVPEEQAGRGRRIEVREPWSH